MQTALPAWEGRGGQGLLGLETMKQVGVWFWASLPPKTISACQFPKPHAQGIGKGAPSLGWESWPKGADVWRNGGRPSEAELAGFLGFAAAFWGQRVHSLASQVMGPPCWQSSNWLLGL